MTTATAAPEPGAQEKPAGPPAAPGAGWALLLASLCLTAPIAKPLWQHEPALILAGPVAAALLGMAAAAAPGAVSVWTGAVWALLGLMAGAARLAEASQAPILGLPPETLLIALLGVLYLVGEAYVWTSPMLEPRMKLVLALLGLWGLSGVFVGLGRGLTLWDLVMRRGSPIGGTGPYADPTFVGVNAFLICAVAVGLFDLFARLVRREWLRAGAVLALVLTLFAGERYLLDRFDARGLPSFRTVVREATRRP